MSAAPATATREEQVRILVVDDEPVVLDLVRDVVKDLSQEFDVEVARDAFDAGRLVAVFRPQLIFLDLMMPGVDGFEVCKTIKADPSHSALPIILLSARGQDHDRQRGLCLGAADYMLKPYSPSELIHRVRELLEDVEVGEVR